MIYRFSKTDGIKILKGAGIACAGALATYLLEVAGQIDFGEWTPLAVAAISVLVNAIRKFVHE